MPRNSLIQLRQGTYTQWDSSSSTVLSSGEPGFITNFNILKIGDGTKQWSDLPAINDSLVTIVRNDTGSTINKMSVVYINGAQGDTPRISLALASGEAHSSKTYGFVVNDIPTGNIGSVIVDGTLRNLNTSTQFNGVNEGTALWLSPTVSGGITTSKPYAPYHSVFVGTLIRKHSHQGVINVKIQNGYELEELHNVATTGATNGQFLQYNSASGLWVASSSGNFTTLNINGPLNLNSDPNNNEGCLFTIDAGGTVNLSTYYSDNISIYAGTEGDSTLNLGYNDGNLTNITNIGGGTINFGSIGSYYPSINIYGYTSINNDAWIFDADDLIGIGNLTSSSFIKSGGTSTQFLKADGSVDSTSYQPLLSNPVTGIGVANHIAYWNSSSGIVADSGQLYWDSTNNRLGIGISSPTSQLHVIGSGLFTSGLNISNQTASTIASFDSNKNIVSLSTGTYPSLTELSYVKGTTSSIQTQLNNKQATLTNPVVGTGIANYISKWTNSSGLVNSSIVDDGSQSVRFGYNQYLYISDDWFGGELGLLLSDQTVIANKNSDGSFGYGGGYPGNENIVVASDGKVGIGTNSPSSKLTVNGAENVFAVIGDDLTYGGQSPATILKGYTWFGKNDGSVGIGAHHANSGALGSAAAFYMFEGFNENVTAYTPICFAAGYNAQLFLNTDLNVGIGTTNPSEKLHINGNIQVDGNLTLNNNIANNEGSKITVDGLGITLETYSTQVIQLLAGTAGDGVITIGGAGGDTTNLNSTITNINGWTFDGDNVYNDNGILRFTSILSSGDNTNTNTDLTIGNYTKLSHINWNINQLGDGVFNSVNAGAGNVTLGLNTTFDQYGLFSTTTNPLWIISDLSAMQLVSQYGITIDADTSNLILQPASNAGSIGIGTNSPNSNYRLDVNGSIGDSTNGYLNLNGLNVTNNDPTNITVDAGGIGFVLTGDGTIDITSNISNQINLNGNVFINGALRSPGEMLYLWSNFR
jgi:hypothetical protein